MVKNLFLLVLLTWVTLGHARHPVAQEHMADTDSFKIQKPFHEHAQPEVKARSIAGGKTKKIKNSEDVKDSAEESGSEIKYWQYQE